MRSILVLLFLLLYNQIFSEVIFSDDFESGILESYWIHGGTTGWVVINEESNGSNYSARSGEITDSETSEISVVKNIPALYKSNIRFYKKTSSESNFDYLMFYINGELIDKFSGNSDWTVSEYDFDVTGEVTFTFQYSKDASLSYYDDCVWIDDIVIEPVFEFSLQSGYYPQSETLYITYGIPESTIYYTDNNTDPDLNNSQVYNNNDGISFSKYTGPVTFKAVAYIGTQISSITLQQDYLILEGNHLIGDVFGSLYKSSSPYYVIGDISIPDDQTLNIEPGVEILFTDNYVFNVKGCLRAEGQPSEKIKFSVAEINEELYDSNETEEGGWGGIRFNNIAVSNLPSLINYCEFSYGKAFGGWQEDLGGAIYIYGTTSYPSRVTIMNSDFVKNKSETNGGAIYITGSYNSTENDSEVKIINNNVSENRAGWDGGGIGIWGNYINLCIEANKIENNFAEYGGGISINNSNATIKNNFIYGNQASKSGNALYSSYSTPFKFYNNLVYNNISDPSSSSGFFVLDDTNGAEIFNNTLISNEGVIVLTSTFNKAFIKNNIIYNNNDGANQFSGNPKNSEFYNCIIQNGESNLGNNFTGIYENCFDVDPEIDPITNYSLLTSSYCINSGSMSVLSSDFPDTDIEGNSRIFDANGNGNTEDDWIDIGAYEYQGMPTIVTIPEFSHITGTYHNTQYINISCNTENAEIRYTIDGSEPNGSSILYSGSPIPVSVDTIIKAKAYKSGLTESLTNNIQLKIIIDVYGNWTSNESPVFINTNFEIPLGEQLTIQPGVEVIFTDNYELRVNGTINAIGTADEMIHFTINDSTGFGKNSTNQGGWKGINIFDSNTTENTFEYCKFEYGKKLITDSKEEFENGGFIYNLNSKLKTQNCIFRFGKAKNSGAIFSQGSDLKINGCLIDHNYAESDAAISIENSGEAYINNCTVVNNSQIATSNYSGAISIVANTQTYIQNTILYDNTSTSPLANIYIGYNSIVNVSNCLIQNGKNSISIVDSSFNPGQLVDLNIIDVNPSFTLDEQNPYSLLASSPCVEMGNKNLIASDLPTFQYDLSGGSRIFNDDEIDIGAYELQTEPFLNSALILSSSIFDFTDGATLLPLYVTNYGNKDLLIDFTLEGLSNLFSIECINTEYVSFQDGTAINLEIPKYATATINIAYASGSSSTNTYEFLNFISNDVNYRNGQIDLVGEEINLPDLVISSDVPEYSGYTGQSLYIEWKVTNSGESPTNTSSWTDRVSIYTKEVDPPRLIATKSYPNISYLKVGQYYLQDDCSFDIPNEWIPGDYEIQVVTNAFGGKDLIEKDYSNNSFSERIPLHLSESPQADLIVNNITMGYTELGTGKTYSINWQVENNTTTNPETANWYDAVYLSPDPEFSLETSHLLGKFEINLPETGFPYTHNSEITIPHIANEGTGYIFVICDVNDDIYEYTAGNSNNVSEHPFVVNLTQTGLPNLTSEIVLNSPSATEVFTGQPINITCTVLNQPSAQPPVETVSKDRVYLQTIIEPVPTDYVLYTNTTYNIDQTLIPDETTAASYSFTKNDIIIPLNTGFQSTKAYFDSYLFSSTESAKNTLKFYGYGNIDENEIPVIVNELRSKAPDKINHSKTSEQYNCNLYVVADYDNKVYEGPLTSVEESDNISEIIPIVVTISDYADLVADPVTVDKSEFIPGDYIEVTWTIHNNGLADAIPDWVDRIYISPEATWNKDSSKLLKQTTITEVLVSGDTYTKTALIKIPEDMLYYVNPASFAQSYIHIVTDAANNIYERDGDDTSSNINLSSEVNLRLPVSDLLPVVNSLNAVLDPDHELYAGGKIKVNYSVINSNDAEKTYAKNWNDRISLFKDGKFTPIGTYARYEPLQPGETYNVSQYFDIPIYVPEGSYQLYLMADADNAVYENGNTGNNYIYSTDYVYINQRDPCDLIVTEVSIDFQNDDHQIFAGQPFTFTYTVENLGPGMVYEDYWNDGYYLSRDRTWDASDMLIGSRTRVIEIDDFGNRIPFTAGKTYTQTVTDTLNTQVYGSYYLIVKADMQNKVYEYMTENNNCNYKYVDVNYTNVVDLAVSNVEIDPDPVNLDDPSVTVSYTVTNHGAFAADGLIRDAVYVSTDREWNSDAILIEYIDRDVNIASDGGTDEVAVKTDFSRTLPTDSKGNPVINAKGQIDGYLPGLEPGSYYIIVKTNITFSIREDINNELGEIDNNTCAMDLPFEVKVPEISLRERLTDVLPKEGTKYYQITVPDTSDVSLRVNLNWGIIPWEKNDDTDFNEMYIKYGSMPTLSNHDYAYDQTYSLKQEILVPNTQPGTYYLMVKNRSFDGEIQNITLDAYLIGFELLRTDQEKGGNGGELTIKLNGSGFDYGVKAKLVKNIKQIVAKETYYVDPTEMYATFDLKGADIGSYDITLVKDMSRYEFEYETQMIEDEEVQIPINMFVIPDSIETTLTGALAVEASNRRGYLENKDIPETVRGGRGFQGSIEISNISNNDIIAPLYLLKVGTSSQGTIKTKLPGESDYTAGYKKFLVLANEGPAGIIRPGCRGNVPIYATAPPANEFMRFDMVKIQDSGFEFDFSNELAESGFDKEDPNWTESIYALEQEIGNSWEGYNKVLSLHTLNRKYHNVQAKEILINKICCNNNFKDFNHELSFLENYIPPLNFIPNSSKYWGFNKDILELVIREFEKNKQYEGATWLEYYTYKKIGERIIEKEENGEIIEIIKPINTVSIYFDQITHLTNEETLALIGQYETRFNYENSLSQVCENYKTYFKQACMLLLIKDKTWTPLPEYDFENIGLYNNMTSSSKDSKYYPNFRVSGGVGKALFESRLTSGFAGMQGAETAFIHSIKMVKKEKKDCNGNPTGETIYSFDAKLNFIFSDGYNFDDDDDKDGWDDLFSKGSWALDAAYEWEYEDHMATPFTTYLQIYDYAIKFDITF